MLNQITIMFDASGFPLWLAILGLLFAGVKLKLSFNSSVFSLHKFDQKATLPLRGILAVLVVLGHLKLQCPDEASHPLLIGWETPAVAVFLFMSGYGLCKSVEAKGDSYLTGFLPRSLRKLIGPLAVVVMFYATYLLIRGCWFSMFLQFWKDGNTPVPNTWYVYALMLMYTIWWLTWRCFSKSLLRLLSLWFGVFVYFCVMEFALDWNYVWARTIFAFPIGACFAVKERKIIELICHSPLRFYYTVVTLLATAVVIRAMFPSGVVAIAGRGLTSTLGLFVILVWYALPLPDFKVLNFLGSISYELYLVHGIVIALTLPLLKYGFTAYSIIVFACSLLCSILLRIASKKRTCRCGDRFGTCRRH